MESAELFKSRLPSIDVPEPLVFSLFGIVDQEKLNSCPYHLDQTRDSQAWEFILKSFAQC